MAYDNIIEKLHDLNSNYFNVIKQQLLLLDENNFYTKKNEVIKEIYNLNKSYEVSLAFQNRHLTIEEVALASKNRMELGRGAYRGQLMLLTIKSEEKTLNVYKFIKDDSFFEYHVKIKKMDITSDKLFLNYKLSSSQNVTIKTYLNDLSKSKATAIKNSLHFLYHTVNGKPKETPAVDKLNEYIKKYRLDFNKIILNEPEYQKKILEIKDLENLISDDNLCYKFIKDIQNQFCLSEDDFKLEEKNKLKNTFIGIKKFFK